ncbi:putative C6 zink-finger protein PRO1A [Rosellinia necatrix]|uniref:Putative C6 zink-finger protein PRO1A n=1 Tax=Rosellinia necatrix TaxID=77044 RepID=A0A1W2TQC5_ROSNE|nr:putative C6 zink-finger protein PRO1A [Rosellinia necatrix]
MAGPLTLVTSAVGLPWSERRGLAGEDCPTVLSTGPRWTNPVPTAQMNAVPLSPISTTQGLQSATSSDTTWDTAYQGDGSARSADEDVNWRHGMNDGPSAAVPKIEPVEEDNFRMDDVQEAPRTSSVPRDRPASGLPKAKRPRGRPRKHPLTPQVVNSKIAKGRSKTGCITCRKRKKKCDEAKPRCLNCEKNAVVCEGYHEKTLWKSGREKAEEERQRKQSLPHITLQPIFQGVETPEDRIFFGHYINHLSSVLTVEGQHKNAFRDMLLQMAVEHHGLMHSILSLASKHIDFETPYGMKLLTSSPNVNLASLTSRSHFHHNAAMKQLLAWGNKDEGAPEQKANLAPRYGQMLCLMLQTAAEGSPDGAHRVHLQAYKSLISENPPPNKAFTTFITEFFQYRVFADELIRYPDMQTKRLATEDWVPWTEIEPARLIGVGDGLFHHLAKITTIRNEIRANMLAKVDPVVDYAALYRATEIDVAIREWAPTWPAGDNRDRVSLLYKQMMWVYLFRTIYCPWTSSPSPFFTSSVIAETLNGSSSSSPALGVGSSGITAASSAAASMGDNRIPLSPASQPCSTTLSPPPSSTSVHPPMSTSSSSDRRLSSSSHNGSSPFQSTPNTTNTAAADSSPSSPISSSPSSSTAAAAATIRHPPNYNARISLAVDESLAILDSFKPGDPVQTLLLVPCLVVGCAAFAPSQQRRVRAAVATVRGYTGLRNCDRVAEVLEEVWRLMACAEWARVWDWQGVARSMGLDFACA